MRDKLDAEPKAKNVIPDPEPRLVKCRIIEELANTARGESEIDSNSWTRQAYP